MIQRNLKVITRPGGTEGWKDTIPYRKANIKGILLLVAVIFGCGIITTPVGYGLFQWRFGNSESPITAVAMAETTPEATAPFVVSVNTPLPTPTDTLTPSPTNTPMPTATLDLLAGLQLMEASERIQATSIPPLQLTVDALEARMQALAERTPELVEPTEVPVVRHAGVAVVTVDVALIRFNHGTGYRPMLAVPLGTELRLTGISRYGWYEVFYNGGSRGWIYGELIRIEAS